MESRKEFESWASKRPREWDVSRMNDRDSWPGQYQKYHVQSAWEAWIECERKKRNA